jgi:hypothetical protein
MIIGYSILYVDDDITVKEIIWHKRVVYSTWEKAIEKATEEVDDIKKKCDDYSFIALIASNSKENCDRNGSTQIYRIQGVEAHEVGNIYIIPVYDE